MKYAILFAASLLFILTTARADSAYENLAWALRQQKMTDDIRHHCDIPDSVSDEQIRKRILDGNHDNSALLTTVKALKENDEQRYKLSLSEVSCPY